MIDYQPFPIYEFKTGINTYMQPWRRPIDSFEPLINGYINRGVINKRAGYSKFGSDLENSASLVAIALNLNSGQSANLISALSLPSSSTIIPGSINVVGSLDGTTYTDPAEDGSLVATGGSGTGGSINYTTGLITINAGGGETLSGTIGYYPSLPVMGIMRYIDETTGDISLLVADTSSLYIYNAGTFELVTASPTFTGNITNFFNYTNWQDSPGAPSYIYMVNNKDPVTTFDGTSAAQPTLEVDSTMTPQTIDTCLDCQVYKQRMLYIRPVLSTDGVQNQSIYWSAVNNATNVITDVAGNGGFLAAPTGDIIKSAEFIRDVLVVFFSNSTWIFRYTGNDTAPFRWDKVNNSKSTNAPYSTIAYDERTTSVGGTGLIACDGVNVQRYDIPIIDYYDTNFSINYYDQTFGQRYDNLNQSWMLYVSNYGGYSPDGTKFPLVGGIAPGSDKALIYNFVENSWATYSFQIPLTCAGLFYLENGSTWEDTPIQWQDMDQAWNTYASQKQAPILLVGDTTGHVWRMDDDSSVVDYWYDNGVLTEIPIKLEVLSTRWNPIMELGEKVQFGYIDIYYYVSSVNPENPVQVTLNFYVDNSNNVALSKTLTLDGPQGSEYTFKRIYINLVGQFVQMEIDPNVNSDMQFLGFILWARQSGRLTR